MKTLVRSALALAGLTLLMATAPAAHAAEIGGVQLDDTATVAGRSLKLNGGGVSLQLLFKVYAIALYLPERQHDATAVMDSADTRRVTIRLLRDVSGADFGRSVAGYLNADADAGTASAASAADAMVAIRRLCDAIVALPGGLRKGDMLTLDWVPETGTVVELNKRPIVAPIRERSLYQALLKVWLGEKPASVTLKARLLGQSPELHASAN